MLYTRAAIDGTRCTVTGMFPNNTLGQPYVNADNQPLVGLVGSNNCYDFINTGILKRFPFNKIELACKDTDSNGLLDFGVATSWSNRGDGESDY